MPGQGQTVVHAHVEVLTAQVVRVTPETLVGVLLTQGHRHRRARVAPRVQDAALRRHTVTAGRLGPRLLKDRRQGAQDAQVAAELAVQEPTSVVGHGRVRDLRPAQGRQVGRQAAVLAGAADGRAAHHGRPEAGPVVGPT